MRAPFRMYGAVTAAELHKLLARKAALLIDSLSYDLENLTVLPPTNAGLGTLGPVLRGQGYEGDNIREDKFSFCRERVIRVSTLHSSKCLECAVVLLYLTALSCGVQYDDPAADKLVRNLVYVAVIRAKYNLNVFVPKDSPESALRDLVEVFGEYQAKQGAGVAARQKSNSEDPAEG